MNIIIFAGGAGTRLWPLSRKATPKQFEPLFEGKSTLQLAIERIRSFGMNQIYVSTNERYVDIIKKQVPDISISNIFSEPAKRDLAAAIGLTLMRLKKQGISGTTAMLWSDHMMDSPNKFVDALKQAEALITEDPNRFIFLGEKPRFANHNLGWIHIGEKKIDNQYTFLGWKYRPEISACQKMFKSGDWMWNPGYFVFDIDFVLELYKKHQSDMFTSLEEMVDNEEKIKKEYPKLQSISFDNAIVEKVSQSQAIVLKVDLGWSDPGTLYALKELLANSPEENVTHGKVVTLDTKDAFIYNEEEGKIVTTVGIDGLIVVNTKDAMLVCHKDHVPNIKKLLDEVEKKGYADYL